MLTHLRLFRIVSTIGMITALFSSLPFTPASAQKKFDATSSFLSTTWYVANTGNDANSCLAADSPCETINGALAKVAPEDTIKVAIGTYTGTGTEVVQIDKNITISGGWNAAFTAQDGRSIIDGQEIRNGIYVNSAPYVVIDRFTIRNGGLGVHNFSGTLTLNNSLVTGNVGGGVDNYGIMTINNTLITENIAYSDCCSGGGGGAGIKSNGSLTLNNSTVSRNTLRGGHSGSGINAYGALLLNNSTVTENIGGYGEGVYAWFANTTLNNSTISGNQSYGISILSGTLIMQNTILANNGSVGDCRTDDTHGGAVISQGYNLIGNSSGCPFIPTNGDLVDVDPKLGQLIGFPGYIPLATGSPAINAGNPVAPGSSSSACLAVDQRGIIRPVGGRCDMGAYEYAAPGSLARLVIVDGDEQRTGPNMSFAHLLAVAALDSQGSPVSGVSVTFTAPLSDASGTFADSQDQMTMSITNANGVATASLLTANSVVGDYTIAASANGVNTVYFNLQNKAWFVAVGGSDSNSCSVQDFPCATIDGALNKSSRGDIIQIAVGEYTGTVVEGVVIVGKNITLSGGWDAGFTTQSGLSTIDGQGVRGGIYTDADANVIIDRLRIQNTVSAGITNYYSVMILNNSLVTDNNGGGILNNGTLTINRTTISNNTNGDPCCSGGGGGGGIDNSGTLTLNNSLVSANKLLGGFYGSGIYSSPGTLILNNTTVSGNTGGDGAGISTFVGTIILRNSTIASNEGYGLNITAGNVTVQNTIIATNGGRDCYKDTGYGGAINSQGYNLIGTGTQCSFTPMIGDVVGTDANPIDPHIAPLQNYGGPTFTHALISGSHAIDAGNPAFPGSEENACLTTDQRGVARPQGDRCDIGAYELRGPIEIHIGGNEINSYLLGSGESKRVSLPGISSGPVKVADITGNPLFAAERVIYKVKGVNTSFSEMMGLPDGQLDNTYWLPWYNNVDLDTQLRIANVTENPATVQITIGGVVMTPLNLAAGESTRVSYTGVNDGPVQILSDQNIVAAERVIYKVKGVQTSFSEMMALPNRQLDNTYWLPWYNNVGVDTQLRIANASSSPALVIIYIGGESMGPPFTLAVGESMRKSFAGLNTGLVEILSTQNIVVSERMIYKVNGVPTSFSEMMAFTNKQLDTMFWLPWYNNVDLDSQLRLLNLGTSTATVHVYVGGAEVTGSPIMLLPGETKRQSFPGVNGGPVQIVSDQNIVVSERVIYKVHGVNTSLSEMMALPNSQLDTTYWFPWYNNINLDTQLRFGVP